MYPMSTLALFTIARTWKQLRYPLADEWSRMWWYMYTMKYYSGIKKNALESMPKEVGKTGAYYTE